MKVWQLCMASDFDGLAALHARCFARAWDRSALASLLTQPGGLGFGACYDDKGCDAAHHLSGCDGFVLARVAAQEGEILTLAVAPEKQGLGLGRALLSAALTKSEELGANRIYLEVGSQNPSAQALYARYGFKQVGMRKGYYDGKDALVLTLSLPAKFA